MDNNSNPPPPLIDSPIKGIRKEGNPWTRHLYHPHLAILLPSSLEARRNMKDETVDIIRLDRNKATITHKATITLRMITLGIVHRPGLGHHRDSRVVQLEHRLQLSCNLPSYLPHR
jgi:hypothetical protein